jgi:phosphoribosylformylglycinamidine (FGAM) synthase-like enzyme
VDVSLDFAGGLAVEGSLFGEAGGFVVEAAPELCDRIEGILKKHGVAWARIGTTIREHVIVIRRAGGETVRLSARDLASAWMEPVEKAMR